MNSFLDIMACWDTLVSFAAEVGVPERRARGWKATDSIPGPYWLAVARAASERARGEGDPVARARWASITVTRMAEIAARSSAEAA